MKILLTLTLILFIAVLVLTAQFIYVARFQPELTAKDTWVWKLLDLDSV